MAVPYGILLAAMYPIGGISPQPGSPSSSPSGSPSNSPSTSPSSSPSAGAPDTTIYWSWTSEATDAVTYWKIKYSTATGDYTGSFIELIDTAARSCPIAAFISIPAAYVAVVVACNDDGEGTASNEVSFDYSVASPSSSPSHSPSASPSASPSGSASSSSSPSASPSAGATATMQHFFAYTRKDDGTGAPAPLATISVYVSNTLTRAALYNDELGTPLANPLTADTLGFFAFYALPGLYDIAISGGGILKPYTWAEVLLLDTRLADLTFSNPTPG